MAFFVSCQILKTFIRSTFLALSAAHFDFFKKSGFRTVGAHSARIHARINQYPSGRIAQKNAPIRTHQWYALLNLCQYLRQAWPNVKIIIRGDGGFCRWKLLRWCEKSNVSYCIGACHNKVLEHHAAALMKQAEAEFEETGDKSRLFGKTNYSAKIWGKERRMIIKSERL